jgi:hypothetical protein
MSKASTYEAKTEQLILPILERMQFELVCQGRQHVLSAGVY